MKCVVLIACVLALLLTSAAAMADANYFVVMFTSGDLVDSSHIRGSGVSIGAKTGAAATAASPLLPDRGRAVMTTWTNGKAAVKDLKGGAPAAPYSYELRVGVGDAYPHGTDVFLTAFTADTYNASAGRALPTDYCVRVQSINLAQAVDVTWNYSQLSWGSDYPTDWTLINPQAGFWFTTPGTAGAWTDEGVARFTVTIAPVPEPSALLALLSGVGSVGGLMWRKRK